MVRSRLPRALRSQFDSMDFVQAVWTSVFAGPDHEEIAFDNVRHFRGFLAGVAHNKVYEEYRRRTRSKKYELAREESLYVRRGDRETPRALMAPDPSPSQEAQAADRMAELAAGCNPAEAKALELRGRGLTFIQIASQTGLHERTVRELIDGIRDRMEERRWG